MKVKMSARIWQGWYSLVRPLITGTRECAAKRFDLGLLEGADHHEVDHAADHARAVLDRLGAAELAVAGGQVHHRAAHLVHAGLEAHARAGARPSRRSSPACGRPAAWYFS